MNVELKNELIADLTIELQNDPTFDKDVLAVKVSDAIREVMMKRNYSATSYTEKQIEKDLQNYYSIIKNVALYEYNHIGAEFESSHNENSVSRTWVNRDDLFKGLHAFVKVF